MSERIMLAADIGAGSGRICSGSYDGNRLMISEISRFDHPDARIGPDIYRDILYIWKKVEHGMNCAAMQYGRISSIGVDSFTPDFCIFASNGALISNMISYRTLIGSGILKRINAFVTDAEVFEKSGTQPNEILMLAQLFYLVETGRNWMLQHGKAMPLASSINYLLTGEENFDFTSASISMFWDRARMKNDTKLLDRVVGCHDFLPQLSGSFAQIGRVNKESYASGLQGTAVINVGVHDTADSMYYLGELAQGELCINCGTWAAVGVIIDEPVIGEYAFDAGLTNYGLPNGRYMFGNVFPAMMYLQDCMELWRSKGENESYSELSVEAEKFEIDAMDLDDGIFQDSSLDMIEKINQYRKKKNLEKLTIKAEMVRCIYESIALKLKRIIDKLEQATGKSYQRIYMGGGAIKSECFMNVCEAHTGKRIESTCAEATIAGNFIAQLRSIGELKEGEIPGILLH